MKYKSPNAHLIVSALLLLPIALGYGLWPATILPIYFKIEINTTDLTHVFRAMMGLYLGMVLFWIWGIYDSKYWIPATLSNVVFMGGLAIGRVCSIVLDGFPATLFVFGAVVEGLLAFWGWVNLKKGGYFLF
jgi:hypothetical protein